MFIYAYKDTKNAVSVKRCYVSIQIRSKPLAKTRASTTAFLILYQIYYFLDQTNLLFRHLKIINLFIFLSRIR